MAGIEYPFPEQDVTNDVDKVDQEDHNRQERQLSALTAERGGTWADDVGRPTPTIDIPHPHGYNEARNSYEFWNGSAWAQTGGALAAHAAQHENGGGDEVSIAGLSGEAADPQPPKIHGPTHEPGGSDEIFVTAGAVDVVKVPAIKSTPGTINKGQVVYAVGWDDPAQASKVELARSDVVGTLPAGVGIAAETITDSVKGKAILLGRLTGLNTSAFNVGDRLWVSATTAGALVKVRPTGTSLVLPIAQVVKKDGALGIIVIAGMGWGPNDLPNLPLNNLWIGNASGNPILIPLANVQAHAPQAHAASHEGGGDAIAIAGIGGDLVGTPRPPTAHEGSHILGGADPFLSTDILDAIIRRIRTTTGPTDLLVGAIADGHVLVRLGSTIVGGGAFGQNAQEAESLTLSTTTAITPQQKLRLTTPSLPAGKYRIGWGYSWYYTNGSNDFAGQVQVDDDGALILMQHQQAPADTGTDQQHRVSGFAYITFGGAGAHTIDLDFYRIGGVGTAGIQNARLEIWRIS